LSCARACVCVCLSCVEDEDEYVLSTFVAMYHFQF